MGTVLETNHNIDQYFQLDEINQGLLMENAWLRARIVKKEFRGYEIRYTYEKFSCAPCPSNK